MIQNELKTSVYDIAVFALILWWNCSAASQKTPSGMPAVPFPDSLPAFFPEEAVKMQCLRP